MAKKRVHVNRRISTHNALGLRLPYEVTLIFVVHKFENSAGSSLLKMRFPLYYPLSILVSAGNRDILLAIGDQKEGRTRMVAPVQPERENRHA